MIDPRVGALAAGCALFAGVILAEVYRESSAEPSMVNAAPRTNDAAAAAHLPGAPSADSIATSLARPLFSPTRRPAEIAQSGPVTSELTDKRLAGIVVEPERRLAIFAVAGGKPVTVTEGEEIGGWQILTITAKEISVRGPGGTKTLQPKIDPSATAPVRTPLASASQAPARAVPPATTAAPPAAALPPNLNPGAPSRRNRE
jgi:hypothetical protein